MDNITVYYEYDDKTVKIFTDAPPVVPSSGDKVLLGDSCYTVSQVIHNPALKIIIIILFGKRTIA